MVAPGMGEFVTPRAEVLSLRSAIDPGRLQEVRRGERLLIRDRLPAGFVELDYRQHRWFAMESTLEPWRGPAPAMPPPAPPRPAPAPPAAPRVAPPGYNAPPAGVYGAPPAGAWGSGMAAPCIACGRSWGGGRSCQFCRQVTGLPSGVYLSSPAKRLGGYLVEGLLAVFTLGIGWLIWALIVYQNGQTPAKQLLGMRVVNLRTSARASWGRMFLREFVAKTAIWLLCVVTAGFGIIVYFWLIWDKDHQELWDKMAGTVVVDDPNEQI